MRTRNPLFIRFVLLLPFLSIFDCNFSTMFAQGSLTPPGAPAATMKSLDQIEARTPISSVPFTIVVSGGSYYLTKNVTVATGDAIIINASNVTLDLNGFTISSTQNPASGGTAIGLGGGAVRNIAIFNGAISSGVTVSGGTYSGTGFGYGIATFSAPTTVRVRGVSVTGVLSHGIYLGFGSTVVEGCTVDTAGGYGIYAASVTDSTALNCGTSGVLAYNAANCNGTGTGSGNGVQATTASNCYGSSSGSGAGVAASTASNCYGTSATGNGVNASDVNSCYGSTAGYIISSGINGDTVNNSRGFNSNGGSGVTASAASNCYGYAAGDGVGVDANYTANNCYGFSSNNLGLRADLAIGCYGASTSGVGLYAKNAVFCIGYRPSGGAISTTVANGCYASSGTISANFYYNTPGY